MSLLIKDANLYGKRISLFIQENKIAAVYPADAVPDGTVPADLSADTQIDAAGKIVIPSFKNGHTHAAMTLLRGFADDMELQPWLEKKIWPAEAKLTPDDIYWGTRLAALEMIKSGTTFCNDMYFHLPSIWSAFRDAGMKAAVGAAIIDRMDTDQAEKVIKETEHYFKQYGLENDRLLFSPAPHAIYTVSEETLGWVADFSRKNNLVLHIHLSETEQEVRDCVNAHGVRPVEYLDKIGFLGPNVVAAHCIWLSEAEMHLLADHKVTVVHNPVSNMKLASGSCFQFRELNACGVPMMLGTDGCSSNNNLDMLEEMKVAALLQKHHFSDTKLMSAEEIFTITTGGKTDVYPILSSEIRPGAYADLLLINPDHPQMVPNYNTVSNIVYSCGEEAIDTVICNGEVLMQNRQVQDEAIILSEAGRCSAGLLAKVGRD